jgi:hypothetical protein
MGTNPSHVYPIGTDLGNKGQTPGPTHVGRGLRLRWLRGALRV